MLDNYNFEQSSSVSDNSIATYSTSTLIRQPSIAQLPITSPGRSARDFELSMQFIEAELDCASSAQEAFSILVREFGRYYPITYCRLLKITDDGKMFIPCAAYTADPNLTWSPQSNRPLSLFLLPDGTRLSELRYSLIGRHREPLMQVHLQQYSELLGCQQSLKSLLLISLKRGNQLRAVIELGELSERKSLGLSEAETHAIILHAPGLLIPLSRWLDATQKIESEPKKATAQAVAGDDPEWLSHHADRANTKDFLPEYSNLMPHCGNRQQLFHNTPTEEQIILLVDNKKSFRSTVREYLTLHGYKVLEAHTHNEAMEISLTCKVALVVIDLRLINDEDESDRSGFSLAQQLSSRLPKIILTAFPTYQDVREALGSSRPEGPLAVQFIAKQEGLQALLATIRLALSPVPPTLRKNLLKTFQTDDMVNLRECINDLGVRKSIQYLKDAEARTIAELTPQRDAALRRAGQLHVFSLIAKGVVLALLTAATFFLLFGSTSAGTLSAIVSALVECLDLLYGKQEKQAYKRADSLLLELQKTQEGTQWLLMCEAFEDTKLRDECRQKVLEHLLKR